MTDENARNPDLIDSPIVFYDGECGLCHGFVKFLLKRDRRNRLRFAPLQGTTADRVLNEADRWTLNTVVFAEGNRTYRYSSAVVRILWRLGRFWKLCGGLFWLVPKPVRDWLYGRVARHRYRIFGKRDRCELPAPETRERFLP